MFPADFVQRIGGQNYLDSGSLLKALEEPSPVSIRRNTERWSKVPFDSEPVPWSSGGFWLAERPSFTLDPLFHAGCYYPQEASGMFLEQVVKQTIHSLDNVKVLDLCAAPGGKSLILSDMIGPGGLLVANEVIRQRASVLAETITKWGNDNTLVTQSDPGAFGKLPGFFDIILCDAPCSGEGMFRTEIAVKEWSKTNTDHCSERQKRILMDVWPSLKENGMLIYSTCTFNPGENEENIKWLTEKHDAESISLDISQFDGITEIEYKGIVGYGFHPGKVRGEGLFVSVIRKKEGESFKPQKTSRMSDFRASKSEKETAIRWTNFNSDNLLKTGEDLFALPCDRETYSLLYGNLKVVKPGTRIFSLKKSDFIPSHELALSSALKVNAFPLQEITLREAVSFLKRDSLSIFNAPKGWNLVTFRRVNIGFVNNIGNRLNNYYPVEWRIRMDIPGTFDNQIIKWHENGNESQ